MLFMRNDRYLHLTGLFTDLRYLLKIVILKYLMKYIRSKFMIFCNTIAATAKCQKIVISPVTR